MSMLGRASREGGPGMGCSDGCTLAGASPKTRYTRDMGRNDRSTISRLMGSGANKKEILEKTGMQYRRMYGLTHTTLATSMLHWDKKKETYLASLIMRDGFMWRKISLDFGREFSMSVTPQQMRNKYYQKKRAGDTEFLNVCGIAPDQKFKRGRPPKPRREGDNSEVDTCDHPLYSNAQPVHSMAPLDEECRGSQTTFSCGLLVHGSSQTGAHLRMDGAEYASDPEIPYTPEDKSALELPCKANQTRVLCSFVPFQPGQQEYGGLISDAGCMAACLMRNGSDTFFSSLQYPFGYMDATGMESAMLDLSQCFACPGDLCGLPSYVESPPDPIF